MQVVVVRHGQSTNNAGYARATAAGLATASPAEAIAQDVRHYPGRVPDPPLSALGWRQARALGEALGAGRAAFTPTHLYASPTTRAVQTAGPLAQATGWTVRLHPDTYEVGGIHAIDPDTLTRHARPGATLAQLREHCPDVEAPPGLFRAAGDAWAGGFEDRDDQALARARRLIADLRRTHREQDVVLLVSHQYFSQFLLAAAFGWPGPPWRWFRVDNTGHLSLRLVADRFRIDWINRVDHLDPLDVTN